MIVSQKVRKRALAWQHKRDLCLVPLTVTGWVIDLYSINYPGSRPHTDIHCATPSPIYLPDATIYTVLHCRINSLHNWKTASTLAPHDDLTLPYIGEVTTSHGIPGRGPRCEEFTVSFQGFADSSNSQYQTIYLHTETIIIIPNHTWAYSRLQNKSSLTLKMLYYSIPFSIVLLFIKTLLQQQIKQELSIKLWI